MKSKRYDLNKKIKVTLEMQDNYYRVRQSIIREMLMCLILCTSLFVSVFLLKIQMLIPALIGFIFAIISFIVLSYLKKAGRTTRSFLDHCIKPFISQIDENIIVSDSFELDKYPWFDVTCDPFSIGRWLVNNYVIPEYKSRFEVKTVIDGLSNNDDGFYFFNGEAISEYRSKNSGTHKEIEFSGPVITVKTKLKTLANVSLYTSSSFFGKEVANGYGKIRNTIDTENDEFNRSFQVTSEQESQAFYVLTPVVMENLLKLKEVFGDFGLLVHDGYLTFGLDCGMMLQYPTDIVEAMRMSFENSIYEMIMLLNMVYMCKDAIDLNTDTNYLIQ